MAETRGVCLYLLSKNVQSEFRVQN